MKIPHKDKIIPEKYVDYFELNGLAGRLVKLPNSRKQREILFVYGHHASLERMYPFMVELNKYGKVVAPDLPGFGGMDSLYKIDEEPSIDTLADYLAGFIKFQFKRRQLTLVGFSLGFAVITRMLQKYPDIGEQVDVLVSVAGFTSKSDFKIPSGYFKFLKYAAVFFSGKYTSKLFRGTLLNPMVIKFGYQHTKHARTKLSGFPKHEVKKMLDFEVELWRSNDVRTHMRTTVSMFSFNLTLWQVPITLHHISFGDSDQYLNENQVLENMNKIYQGVRIHRSDLSSHMPTVYLENYDAGGVFPPSLRRILSRKPR